MHNLAAVRADSVTHRGDHGKVVIFSHRCMAAIHGLLMPDRREGSTHSFHLKNIRRILGISWQDKVTTADAMSRAGLPSMNTLLRQRRLRRLGHVRHMEDGRIPKYILYVELALGSRTTGRAHLQYKYVCMRKIYEGCRHRHYVL